jgi:hypothetical protein
MMRSLMVPPPTAVIIPKRITPKILRPAPLALYAPVMAKANVPNRSKKYNILKYIP